MRYGLAIRTTGVAIATAAWEIRCNANVRAKIMEFGVFLGAGNASTFGLGRPTAIGITPTTPVDFQPNDPADIVNAGQLQSALAWGTGPTAPGSFFRRISMPATTGTGVIWTFPEGLTIPAGGSIVLWNIQGNAVADAYAEVEQ
jgi:hypothetical protein